MNRGIQMYCISELCCLQVRSNTVLHVCVNCVDCMRRICCELYKKCCWQLHGTAISGDSYTTQTRVPSCLKVLIKSIALTRTSSPQLWNEDGYYNKPLIWPQRKILCSYLIIVLLLNKFSANYQLAEKWTSLWTITPESLYRYMQC